MRYSEINEPKHKTNTKFLSFKNRCFLFFFSISLLLILSFVRYYVKITYFLTIPNEKIFFLAGILIALNKIQ